jgi:hypothetical protein
VTTLVSAFDPTLSQLERLQRMRVRLFVLQSCQICNTLNS